MRWLGEDRARVPTVSSNSCRCYQGDGSNLKRGSSGGDSIVSHVEARVLTTGVGLVSCIVYVCGLWIVVRVRGQSIADNQPMKLRRCRSTMMCGGCNGNQAVSSSSAQPKPLVLARENSRSAWASADDHCDRRDSVGDAGACRDEL